jgi:hypothetical protein
MKRMRILGLCLVAVFALAAAATSSATAATPAFWECAKVAAGAGKYTNKTCSTEGTGKTAKYELKEGIGKAKEFKGSGKTATLHTPALGSEIKCTAFKDEGKLKTSTAEEKVLSTFSGCTTLGKKCASAGEKAGDIKTFALGGVLGAISGGSGAGALLTAESGKYLAEFSCEGLAVKVEGGVIGEETPVETFTKTEKTIFQVTGSDQQEFTSFTGGGKEVLESTIGGEGPYESAQQAEAANKGEELEIKL